MAQHKPYNSDLLFLGYTDSEDISTFTEQECESETNSGYEIFDFEDSIAVNFICVKRSFNFTSIDSRLERWESFDWDDTKEVYARSFASFLNDSEALVDIIQGSDSFSTELNKYELRVHTVNMVGNLATNFADTKTICQAAFMSPTHCYDQLEQNEEVSQFFKFSGLGTLIYDPEVLSKCQYQEETLHTSDDRILNVRRFDSTGIIDFKEVCQKIGFELLEKEGLINLLSSQNFTAFVDENTIPCQRYRKTGFICYKEMWSSRYEQKELVLYNNTETSEEISFSVGAVPPRLHIEAHCSKATTIQIEYLHDSISDEIRRFTFECEGKQLIKYSILNRETDHEYKIWINESIKDNYEQGWEQLANAKAKESFTMTLGPSITFVKLNAAFSGCSSSHALTRGMNPRSCAKLLPVSFADKTDFSTSQVQNFPLYSTDFTVVLEIELPSLNGRVDTQEICSIFFFNERLQIKVTRSSDSAEELHVVQQSTGVTLTHKVLSFELSKQLARQKQTIKIQVRKLVKSVLLLDFELVFLYNDFPVNSTVWRPDVSSTSNISIETRTQNPDIIKAELYSELETVDSNNPLPAQSSEMMSLSENFSLFFTIGYNETFEGLSENVAELMTLDASADKTFTLKVSKDTTEQTVHVLIEPFFGEEMLVDIYKVDSVIEFSQTSVDGKVRNQLHVNGQLATTEITRSSAISLDASVIIDSQVSKISLAFEAVNHGINEMFSVTNDIECDCDEVSTSCAVVDKVPTCFCLPGFTSDPNDPHLCIDIDECQQVNDCMENSHCTNHENGFSCECDVGYTVAGTAPKQGQSTTEFASQNSALTFSISRRRRESVSLDPRFVGCENVNECLQPSSCPAASTCTDSIGSFDCTCFDGYRHSFTNNTHFCTDIDECAEDLHSCAQVCINSPGAFLCECEPGYQTTDEGVSCDVIRVVLPDSGTLTAADLERITIEQKNLQGEALESSDEIMDRKLKSMNSNATTEEAENEVLKMTKKTVTGVTLMTDSATDDPEKDATMKTIERVMSMEIQEANAAKQDKLLETITRSSDFLSEMSKMKPPGTIVGDEVLLATRTDITNTTTFRLPLHEINFDVPLLQRRLSSSPSLVAMKNNPYGFGEEVKQPLITMNDADAVNGVTVKIVSDLNPQTQIKKISAANLQILKVTPKRHHELFVWFTPSNASQSIEVYYEYGYIPDPDKLLYRHKIVMPTNTFMNEFSVRKCNDETDCEKIDRDDPEGFEIGSPFGIRIPKQGEIDLCFHKFGDKCKIVFALRLNDIEKDAETEVAIETINTGCRMLNKGQKSWSRDKCSVSLKTTPNSTICNCDSTETNSFSVTSDIFVPPRRLNFGAISSTAFSNAASITIIMFSVGLLTVYLFGTFYAQESVFL